MQPQSPEHPRLLRGQPRVGPVEHRPHRITHVPVPILATQPPAFADLDDDIGDIQLRAGGDPRRRDPHRQRQPTTYLDQRRNGVRLGIDPLTAKNFPQQRVRFSGSEQLEAYPVRGFGDHQVSQAVTARDHAHAPKPTGQQRPHLLGTRGVVQYHQHPPPSQHRPVQPRLSRHLRRDLCLANPQRRQQQRQHHRRVQRSTRPKPTQIHEQRAVREPMLHSVRPLHDQRGLPGTTGAIDNSDHCPTVVTLTWQQIIQSR
jgi:hypothetical protein